MAQVYWHEVHKLPDISPARRGFEGISKELQFIVCKHSQLCENYPMAREGECLYKEERETERAMVITLEKEMATHSSILAWKFPWREKPGGLQSMGSQEVEHNLVTEHT